MIASMLQKNPVQKVVTNRSLTSPSPSPFVKCLTAKRNRAITTAAAILTGKLEKSSEILRQNAVRNREKTNILGIISDFKSLKDINPR